MNSKNYNSPGNQTIKEKFVEKEVFGCISSLMDRIVRDEKKEISIERDVLLSIITLIEDIIKGGKKDSSAEREIIKRTNTLTESINNDKKCAILEEIENLYRYNVTIPDLKNLVIHERIPSKKGTVIESERKKLIAEIREKIAELKGEESISDLMLEDEEISDETNKENQSHIDARIAELERYLTGIENVKGEQQKIVEWLHVSNWLHDKLREKGEPVWNDGKVFVWGRISKGQSASSDQVISEICNDMEILEGQKNEWKR